MANPQLENGYIRIARELMINLSRIRIAGEPRQVLDYIIIKTYGFQKKEDKISLSQFEQGTGLKRRAVCKAIDHLLKMKLIIKKGSAKNGTILSSVYCVQKDYEKWRVVPKTALVPKTAKGSAKNGQRVVPKTAHTKDIFTKDILQKIYSVFWRKYPKKFKKDYANKCFLKLEHSTETFRNLFKGLEKAKKSQEWKEKQYIPYPSTWINNKGWKNGYTIKKTDEEIGNEEVERYYQEHPEERNKK